MSIYRLHCKLYVIFFSFNELYVIFFSLSICFVFYSDFLVTVRAQVMTRDESTEGWLPLAGGGLANVSIRKRARLSPLSSGHDYIIYGQRISDQSVSKKYNTNTETNSIRFLFSTLYVLLLAGYIELRDQSRFKVSQGYANISSLARRNTAKRFNISNSSRCTRLRQGRGASL